MPGDTPRLVGSDDARPGYSTAVFLFFSNRLGCVGSVLVSLVATVILVLLLRLL
jgi:hypothetical protein